MGAPTPPRFSTGTQFEPPFSTGTAPLLQVQNAAAKPSSNNLTSPKPHAAELSLPAAYRDVDGNLRIVDEGRKATDRFSHYLERELDLSRLNGIHEYLWLAGRPTCARPLHRQVLVGRELVVTEQVDLHLVWQESRIFVKPLPDFLMDHDFWKQHICQNPRLRESATGLLLSYIWLVSHPSDLTIAKEAKLLSAQLTWEEWAVFVRQLMQHIQYDSLLGVNERYRYGELRLNRLNSIYRLSSSTRNAMAIFRGYAFGYNRFSVFVKSNFGWLLAMFVYITIVLTAMQVGLATDNLNKNVLFQNASYGFTVFAILAPLIGFVAIVIALLISIFFNFLSTLAFRKKIEQRRQQLIEERMVKAP